jgi:4a-hydroxytetrahydrobiopterin dehydratase
MSALAERRCEPCKSGVPPLSAAEIEPLHSEIDPDWDVVDGHHLSRVYGFKNFALALAFVNRVGEMAEEQGHHPDLHLSWGKVGVEIWTHKINGLHEADFVFAAKCDALYPKPS